MMKKGKWLVVVAVVALATCLFALAACGSNASSSASSASASSASASAASTSASASATASSASAAASTASESASASSATTEPYADSVFTGDWKCVEYSIGGDTMTADDMDAVGMTFSMSLAATGRGHLDISGQKTMLTWTDDGNNEGTVVTNMPDKIHMDGDQLVFETSYGGDDMVLTFERD